jgi:type II secretory pathway component PulF
MIYYWTGITDPAHPLQAATKPRRISGTEVSDADVSTVSRVLRDRGIEPLRIRSRERPLWIERFRKVKTEYQLAFFESMHFMDALSVQRGVSLCAQRCRDPRYATALAAIAQDVARGMPLDEAMESRPFEFSRLQVAMVRAGRDAAALRPIFKHLAALLQSQYTTLASIRGALLGPAMLAVLAGGVILLMLDWFVPQTKTILDYLHTPVPPMTQFVLMLSALVSSPFVWFVTIVSALGIGMVTAYFWSMPRYRLWIEHRLARVWIFGSLMDKAVTARVARVLSVVLRTVGTARAVRLVMPLAMTLRQRLALEQIAKDCEAGKPLDEAFRRTRTFDPLLDEYLTVGAAGAKQGEACEKVAAFLEAEVARTLEYLTATIEPTMTLGLSAFFTALVLILYMPFMSVMDTIGSLH